jgi:hypothetical protein
MIETRTEAGAQVLALMVAANGRIDPREIRALEGLDAFERVGVDPERFLALARECLDQVGRGLGRCLWLGQRDQRYIDGLLDAVDDPGQRLLLCRLAAAVITADGRLSSDERLVYDRMRARWGISEPMVAQAIRDDRVRAG